jgi:hypothetical protein
MAVWYFCGHVGTFPGHFGIFPGHLVSLWAFWYISRQFGIFVAILDPQDAGSNHSMLNERS